MAGTVLLIYIYPKISPFLEKGETLHQALGSIYDDGQAGWKTVRRWASLWTIFAFLGTVALEFYGAILLLGWAGIPQLQKITLAAILVFICTMFTVQGGLRGITKVDAWLDGISIIGILLLFSYILMAYSDSTTPAIAPVAAPAYPTSSLTDNIIFAFASLFLFVPFQLCALDTWQRGVAWKERRKVGGYLIFGAICIAVASVIAILGGRYLQYRGLVVHHTGCDG